MPITKYFAARALTMVSYGFTRLASLKLGPCKDPGRLETTDPDAEGARPPPLVTEQEAEPGRG